MLEASRLHQLDQLRCSSLNSVCVWVELTQDTLVGPDLQPGPGETEEDKSQN